MNYDLQQMTDLELLTQTLDRLNVYYDIRDFTSRDGIEQKIIDLEEDPDRSNSAKIPYTGYDGFAWIFKFSIEGKLLEVGGYE
jgi:hypothetical protein